MARFRIRTEVVYDLRDRERFADFEPVHRALLRWAEQHGAGWSQVETLPPILSLLASDDREAPNRAEAEAAATRAVLEDLAAAGLPAPTSAASTQCAPADEGQRERAAAYAALSAAVGPSRNGRPPSAAERPRRDAAIVATLAAVLSLVDVAVKPAFRAFAASVDADPRTWTDASAAFDAAVTADVGLLHTWPLSEGPLPPG